MELTQSLVIETTRGPHCNGPLKLLSKFRFLCRAAPGMGSVGGELLRHTPGHLVPQAGNTADCSVVEKYSDDNFIEELSLAQKCDVDVSSISLVFFLLLPISTQS